MSRILFILKKRNFYGPSFGLKNSCFFISESLKPCIQSKIVEVIDGNNIDKEVYLYRPTHIIIEAYWCPIYKLEELLKKYKNIKWTVRSHSKVPFFANEGICIEYLKGYHELTKKYKNFVLSSNTFGFIEPIQESLGYKINYLPNIYNPPGSKRIKNEGLNIGLFGAIRPQKNLLQQSLSAIKFANDKNEILHLHINKDRIEQKGDSIYKNIVNLFKGEKHKLIQHEWMNHDDFVKLVRQMDFLLCVSDTESFCLVAADGANNNVPVIGSPEIEWMNSFYQARPNDFFDIVSKLKFADTFKKINLHYLNKIGLNNHNKLAIEIWKNYVL